MYPAIETYGIEVLTALLVIVTSIYAWLTYKISNTMKKQTEEISRPFVVVYPSVEEGSPMVLLKIENIGARPAYDVVFQLDDEFYQFGDEKNESRISNFSVFQNGIDCFAPGSRLEFYLGVGFSIFSEKSSKKLTPHDFGVRIKYKDSTNSRYSEHMIVDIKPFRNMAVPKTQHEEHMKKVTKSLDEIAKEIRSARQSANQKPTGDNLK